MKAFVMILTIVVSQIAVANTCFNSNTVRGWTYDRETKNLIIKDRKTTYEVKTFPCHDLAWAHQIGFKSFFSSRVCKHDDIVVLDGWDRVVRNCPITSITAVK
jgi:hypothetical protein